MSNEQSKPWYQSKAVIGGVVAAVAGLLAFAGVDIGIEDQGILTDAVLGLVGAIGGILAVYGRVKADRKIK